MQKALLLLFLILGGVFRLPAQLAGQPEAAVRRYFAGYSLPNYAPKSAMRADSCRVDAAGRTLRVYANEAFCAQPFTPQSVRSIYKELSRCLPAPYNTYRLAVCSSAGTTIDELIPNLLREGQEDASRLWGKADYCGRPWVENLSRPHRPRHGLAGRHLVINASHGRYYRGGEWRWQRPHLFCTTEDLLTQSFVFPYLIPMLENAGAVVFTGRERDMQTAEAVVDNDAPGAPGAYEETAGADHHAWHTLKEVAGFAPVAGALTDSLEPFTQGTVRYAEATSRRTSPARVTWSPSLPRAGRYAVYVSYAARPNSVPDARYTVYHKGGRTQFCVNQQMGGGTWVYLGTFDFPEGQSREARVVLSNVSQSRGVVTADAVRFGGGMGQTARGTAGVSRLPRFLEGARYYAQWAGLPDSLLRRTDGTNDYADDLRARSYLTNHFAGGSTYLPGQRGRGVPFELSLALHSDAGVRRDGGIYGSLAVCTTVDGLGATEFPAGMSRKASLDYGAVLLHTVVSDLSRTFATDWTRRELWDRNYSETRVPDVPAAILEMFSHQNFRDMTYAHDPNFKFAMARAVYKATLRYVNALHGRRDCVVQPLPVRAFAARLTPGGEAELSWQAAVDSLEPTARPDAFVVYTRAGDEDFDNGRLVSGGATHVTLPVTPGVDYAFKVTAVNAGGESFPSEVLALRRARREEAPCLLLVNGFDRLSGPARVERADSLGFDLDADPGVARGATAAFAGRQLCFDPARAGQEGSGALGHCGDELAGKIIGGNTFDYPVLHGRALAAAGDYSYASCSREALAAGRVRLEDYAAVDYILGLQRDAPHNLLPYKTFDATVRRLLTDYLHGGGALLVSGAYIGSDMTSADERRFTADVLRFTPGGSLGREAGDAVSGLNLSIPLSRDLRPDAYPLPAVDVLRPAGSGTFTAFAYAGGQPAGVAYPGRDCRVLCMGFPFESIASAGVRAQAMGAIVRFLLER